MTGRHVRVTDDDVLAVVRPVGGADTSEVVHQVQRRTATGRRPRPVRVDPDDVLERLARLEAQGRLRCVWRSA